MRDVAVQHNRDGGTLESGSDAGQSTIDPPTVAMSARRPPMPPLPPLPPLPLPSQPGSLFGAPITDLWSGSPMGVTPPVTPPRSPKLRPCDGSAAPTLASTLTPVDEQEVSGVQSQMEAMDLDTAGTTCEDSVVGIVPIWDSTLRWSKIALAVFEHCDDAGSVEVPLNDGTAPVVRCRHLHAPIMVRAQWVYHQQTQTHSVDHWTRHLFSLVNGEPARTTANIEAFVDRSSGAIARICILRPQAASKLAQMAGAVPPSALLIFDPPEERLEQLRATRRALEQGGSIGYTPAMEAVVGKELAKLPLKGDRSCEGQQVWGETVQFLHELSTLTSALTELHAANEIRNVVGSAGGGSGASVAGLTAWRNHVVSSA